MLRTFIERTRLCRGNEFVSAAPAGTMRQRVIGWMTCDKPARRRFGLLLKERTRPMNDEHNSNGACVVLIAVVSTVIAACPFVALAQTSFSSGKDYLSPELRQRVEHLKEELPSQPSSTENGWERGNLVWEWANAYAVSGGTLPVELPAIMARIMSRRGKGIGKGNLDSMDSFIRELQLRDEQPLAIGKLTSTADKPFLPGSFVTIEQTYEFGDMPMAPGGGFLVAKHFMSNQGAYQTNDPQADNYISISSTNAEARFVADKQTIAGMHGGFRRGTDGLFFRLERGILTSQDKVTIIYGDRSGGSRGFKLQTYSNDAFPLPVYVDLQGSGVRGKRDLFTLPLHPYKVGGGPVHSVRGFAPSIVSTGEEFAISIRSEDFYYNRASGDVPEYRISLNGDAYSTISSGRQSITLLEDIHFDEPGVYRFKVESADGLIRGECNPIWVQQDPTRRVYWGETHGHCGFAEGQGTPEAYFKFGREDARLDFLTHSEHDIWMDDSEWQTLINDVDKYNQDGEFVAILGYEWTAGTDRGGHHNVFFRDTKGRKRVPNQTAPYLTQLFHRLAAENNKDDVLIIPHAHMPGEYRLSDPHMETLVEIMSMHGHFEWFGIMYLNHGHQVGFVAASDDHLSHPGYSTPLPGGLAARGGLAALWAPEKTRNAIFDAMKNLSSYATTGQRIILNVDLNGAKMGTRTTNSQVRTLKARVIGTAPIDTIAVIKNGEEVFRKDLLVQKEPADSTSQTLEVNFTSETDPTIRDSPRGWRPWRGSVHVTGAKLVKISSPALENRLTEFVRRGEGSAADFVLITRGGHKNLVLELNDVTTVAAIEVRLKPVVERTSTPAAYRRAARLPGANVMFRLSDLQNGKSVHPIRVGRFTDSITVKRIRPGAPLEHEFEFIDRDSPQPGDYYFVRVRQIDGGTAWSSPIWVGGLSMRYEK